MNNKLCVAGSNRSFWSHEILARLAIPMQGV